MNKTEKILFPWSFHSDLVYVSDKTGNHPHAYKGLMKQITVKAFKASTLQWPFPVTLKKNPNFLTMIWVPSGSLAHIFFPPCLFGFTLWCNLRSWNIPSSHTPPQGLHTSHFLLCLPEMLLLTLPNRFPCFATPYLPTLPHSSPGSLLCLPSVSASISPLLRDALLDQLLQ